jgi:hypothetical protein
MSKARVTGKAIERIEKGSASLKAVVGEAKHHLLCVAFVARARGATTG